MNNNYSETKSEFVISKGFNKMSDLASALVSDFVKYVLNMYFVYICVCVYISEFFSFLYYVLFVFTKVIWLMEYGFCDFFFYYYLFRPLQKLLY